MTPVTRPGNISPHDTLDPASAAPETDVKALEARLLDAALPMFQRMRAVFSLRNLGGPDAIAALGLCLAVDGSALLRHEVAYVFGQMQDPLAVPHLVRALEGDTSPMVRHESAESLGNIATDEVVPVLQRFLREDAAVEVRESCAVALDNIAYLRDPSEF